MPQWNIITQSTGKSQKSCSHTVGADVGNVMYPWEDNLESIEDSEVADIKIPRAMSLDSAYPPLALDYKLLSMIPEATELF